MKRGNRRGSEKQETGSEASSSIAVLACICALLFLGILFKGAGGIMSGKLYEDVEGSTWSAAASIAIPVVGVAAIRNMRRTQDIRTTMELSLPVCSMGSLLCLLCIILFSKDVLPCVEDIFWQSAGTEQRYLTKSAPMTVCCCLVWRALT